MTDRDNPHGHDSDRLIFAGLLGLSAAVVVQLIDKGDLGPCQMTAVYAFAAAVPLLAVGLIDDYARRTGTHIPKWRAWLGVLGCLAAVVGLGAVFFHFGSGPGFLFAGGSVVGFVLVRTL